MADKGIVQGMELVEQSRKVVQKLYDDGLMVGQKTNRPAPPEPEKDAAGGFYSLFLSKGNNPTIVDRTFAEMWEQHVAQHMKALLHVNPGGWTYSAGWSDLIRDQTIINEADTMLREKATLTERLRKLEGARSGNAGSSGKGR
jgi:hydroxylamine dehydrogenase